MKLTLQRRFNGPDYTIGSLSANGVYFCDTLEDTERGLLQTDNPYFINQIKVHGKTAIPAGTYKLAIRWSNRFKRWMIAIIDVPGFTGILMHSGNTSHDTAGCPLVGKNTVKGTVTDSKKTNKILFAMVHAAILKEDCTIEVKPKNNS